MEPAYTTFATWLSIEHDRKGTQLGAIAYSNGTVSCIRIQVRHGW